MKKILPFFIILLSVFKLEAQTHQGYPLTGNPLNTTGWVLGPQTSVNADEVVLVEGASKTGYFFYQQPKKIFFCDSTVVSFKVRINNSSATRTEGFTFFYAANVNNGFGVNESLGLPINMTGNVVAFDIFDNDNNANNPLISSRSFNNQNYVEGAATGRLVNDIPNITGLSFNNTFDSVSIVFRFTAATAATGNVYINGVNMGAISINNMPALGLFGMSASNSANNYSKVTVKDFNLQAYPLAPEVLVPVYCTEKPPSPFVYPGGAVNVIWYQSVTDNIGSITAPVVFTDTVASYDYWVASRIFSNNQFCYGDKMKVTAKVHQSPEIIFDFSKVEGCGADTIQFSDSSKFVDNRVWNFGDGNGSNLQHPSHIFQSAGTFNVTLVGQNDYCTDSLSKIIKLENPFEVSFLISDDSICQNSSIEFLNTSKVTDKNNIPTIYHWSFSDLAYDTLNAKNPPAKTYYTPGYYEIKLKVTNGLPCTDSFSLFLNVDPSTGVTFSRSDTAICVGDDITFASKVNKGGLTSMTWDFGDGYPTILSTDTITRAFDMPGVYDVTLTADYRTCADSSFSRKVYVNPKPQINLPADTSICLWGNEILISDVINRNNPNAKWIWSTGDTTSSIAVKHHGLYKATVTINGCSTTDEINIAKGCYIDIPNAFSPDGDGNNDFFFPRDMNTQDIARFKMNIYNRWGQVVFVTENISGKGWDGRFNEVDQQFGVYVYTIEVVYQNGQAENYTGNVTLIR